MILRSMKDHEGYEAFAFRCPGCDYAHIVRVSGPRPCWSWNGNLDKPTFTPSLVVGPGSPMQCHSFITDGRIQFLNDSWHHLKGQTVEIPEWYKNPIEEEENLP